MNTPLVTVAICVRNRPQAIVECLDSLLELDFHNCEILVIDDASTDETPVVIAEYQHIYSDAPIRVVRNPESRGISAARNAAIDVAFGEYIFFTDSDCTVDPNWLTEAMRPFEDPSVVAVAGLVFDDPPRNLAERAYVGGARIDGGAVQSRHVVGCNMGFRQSIAAEHRFDESLVYGAEEDDLADRLLAEGYRLEFCPGAIVHHHHPFTMSSYMNLAWRSGDGSARYWWKRRIFYGRDVASLMLSLLTLPIAMAHPRGYVAPLVFLALQLGALIYSEWRLKHKSLVEAFCVLPVVLLFTIVKLISVVNTQRKLAIQQLFDRESKSDGVVPDDESTTLRLFDPRDGRPPSEQPNSERPIRTIAVEHRADPRCRAVLKQLEQACRDLGYEVRPWSGPYSRPLKFVASTVPACDLLILWNGLDARCRRPLASLPSQTRVLFVELGWFPQDGTFQIDPQGVNAAASWVSQPLPHPLPETSPAELSGEHLLVLMQYDRDTQLSHFSPWFRSMASFVEFLADHSAMPLRVRFHPRHKPSLALRRSIRRRNIQVDQSGTLAAAVQSSRAVATINSSAALEAMSLGAPVLCYGEANYRYRTAVYVMDHDAALTRTTTEELAKGTCRLNPAAVTETLERVAAAQWNAADLPRRLSELLQQIQAESPPLKRTS